MPIRQANNDGSLRASVVEYLRERRATGPFRVIDVGGAANNWCDDLVDTYVDIQNPKGSAKRVITGDLNTPEVWEKIAAESWDFAICTHVLEDIRAPDFILKNLFRIAPAGFVSFPNKHTEMSHVESSAWVGYCHHRWIYTVVDQTLRIMGKFSIANYFGRKSRTSHWLSMLPKGDLIGRKLYGPPGGPALDWVDAALVTGKRFTELGIWWEGPFAFEFINGDYAGSSVLELASLYRNELRKGL